MNISGIIELIFPKKCIICDEITKGEYFCEKCMPNINYITDDCCFLCAKDRNFCDCGRGVNSYDKVISVFYYVAPVSNLLVGLKVRQDDVKLKAFAKILKQNIKRKYGNYKFDIIAGVPDFDNKSNYGRIEILCKLLSKDMGIKYYKNCIKKVKPTRKQHTLNGQQRHFNLKGAFLADKSVENKRILLIDDIITTGSTLNACSLEFKNKGAKTVYCATISTTILSESQKCIKKYLKY